MIIFTILLLETDKSKVMFSGLFLEKKVNKKGRVLFFRGKSTALR